MKRVRHLDRSYLAGYYLFGSQWTNHTDLWLEIRHSNHIGSVVHIGPVVHIVHVEVHVIDRVVESFHRDHVNQRTHYDHEVVE